MFQTLPDRKKGLRSQSELLPAGVYSVCTPAEKKQVLFFSGYEYVHPFSSEEDRSEKNLSPALSAEVLFLLSERFS